MTKSHSPTAIDFRVALDAAAIVAVTDAAGTIIECNSRFCEISGYTREELIGANHRVVNSGHHDKVFFRAMYRTIAKGDVWKGTICNRRKNGEFYWVDTTIVPALDDLGKVRAYMALRFDVTAHVAALEALGAAKARAVEATIAKDQFLANMSHEVRTPLNGIIGLAAALTKSDLADNQHEMANLILNSGESLQRILDDILDIAKVEAGKMDIEIREFNLQEEVLSAAELMRIRADEKGLAFTVDFEKGTEGWFEGDPLRLRQILTNLLSNAIKFTDIGSVRTHLTVKPKPEGSVLTMKVEDTGIGFDQGVSDVIFDRFVQADGSTARRYGGTGLGLSISARLVELMGGNISVQSTLGVGSVFSVSIPLRVVKEPVQQEITSNAVSIGAGLRILLAEDHPTNQLVVIHLLEPLGLSVKVASDGSKAIEMFKENSFDIILMDMQMPIMDGLTAVSEIRKIEASLGKSRVPIAMLTANSSEAHRNAAWESGADGFISKPLTGETLIRGINELLDAS